MGLLDEIVEGAEAVATTVGDAVEEVVDRVVDHAVENPVTTGIYVATKLNPFTPTVDIDADETDGDTGVRLTYYGQAAGYSEDDAGNTTVEADLEIGVAGVDGTVTVDAAGDVTDADVEAEVGFGMKAGGHVVYEDGEFTELGAKIDGGVAELEGKVLLDDGEIREVAGSGEVSIPLEEFGIPAEVGIEAEGRYTVTDDGYGVTGRLTQVVEVEELGINFKEGVHSGFEDKGDGDFGVNIGMHSGLGAEIKGVAEGEVLQTYDLDYSHENGQHTIGGRLGVETEAEILGEEIATARLENGVAYTTGPEGDRIIAHAQSESTLGNEDLGELESRVRTQWEVGTDGDGDPVDRVTLTSEVSAQAPEILGGDEAGTSTRTVIGDATGIHDLIVDVPDLADVPLDGIASAAGDVLADSLDALNDMVGSTPDMSLEPIIDSLPAPDPTAFDTGFPSVDG